MFWGLVAAEKVFVFMSLQDDYVRTWDENQGSNDSKLNHLSSHLCLAVWLFKVRVSRVITPLFNKSWFIRLVCHK